MDKIIEFLQKLDNSENIEEVEELSEEFCRSLSIPYYLLAIFYPSTMQRSSLLYISNFPNDWLAYYFENKLKKVDPIVLHSCKSSSPILWQSVSMDPRFDQWKNRQVMSLAAEAQLRDGVSVPIYSALAGMGILSFSSDRILKVSDQYTWMSTALTIAPFLHSAITRINLNKSVNQDFSLTNRERECLLWAGDGKTSWEISTIINVSERTVNFHLNSSIKKLGCSNRSQAIAKALISGLIKPEI